MQKKKFKIEKGIKPQKSQNLQAFEVQKVFLIHNFCGFLVKDNYFENRFKDQSNYKSKNTFTKNLVDVDFSYDIFFYQ